ncbi:uncharacterized protein LOC128204302 [Mya arenaria]|uniref:uncharacterized protein LOC128204302 n=1 Tax=Mya arenaria TaxID=6604 RepID=UPI0022E97B04|nr:uncharacterized protein LOC128204302 [Mya arenaria]
MNRLLELLKVIDGDVEFDGKNLTKLKSQHIDRFLAKHARCRHYIYQKCVADDCAYCTINPPRIPEELFKELYFVPDSTVNANGYTPFDELYGTETDDSGRPSLTLKPQSTAKVRGFVHCCECGKRRVVYSEKRLCPQEEKSLIRVQEELLFVCCAVLFPGGQYQDIIIVKEGQCCSSPIEVTYYAGKTMVFDQICIHCGNIDVVETEHTRELQEQFGIVRPICQTCLNANRPVITRNALKTKNKKNKT